jgi:hypothetical protein
MSRPKSAIFTILGTLLGCIAGVLIMWAYSIDNSNVQRNARGIYEAMALLSLSASASAFGVIFSLVGLWDDRRYHRPPWAALFALALNAGPWLLFALYM